MHEPPLFLTKQTVIEFHSRQILEHGGDPGLRDEGLLESALAQPQVQFGGQYLHDGLFLQAAAYLFHLAKNHAFVDGNKRTALASALVFLAANGYEVSEADTELADVVIEMLEQNRDKAWVAEEFRRRARPAT